jgi:hypothetical protein
MYQFTYHPVNPLDDKTEVAFHNMKAGDALHDLRIFIGGQVGYFKANPGATYQDLELELRKRGFDTHLIARLPANYPMNYKLFMPWIANDRMVYKYEAITSCRPRESAVKELLESWKSYEENFQALKISGTIGVKDANEPISVPPGDTLDMIKDSDPDQQMQNNLVKIKATFITAEQFMDRAAEKIKLEHGVEPELVLYAMGSQGEPIMALASGGKIMSNVGMITSHGVLGERATRLIDLTRIG